jgi:hypothetical protein
MPSASAYCSASNVAAYCTNLLGGAADFNDTSTSPSLVRVNKWLQQGFSEINMTLGSRGYSVPAASGITMYDQLEELNALFGAGHAEMSRLNVTLLPGERTRGQVFLKMFYDGLQRLVDMDLTAGGLTTNSNQGYVYAGGISISDKETYEDDTDRVLPRFKRDMFTFGSTSTEEEDDE